MNILLIKPPINLPDDWKGITFFDPPLGLAYIASILRKNGHKVNILDSGIAGWRKINKHNSRKYVGLSFGAIGKKVRDCNPDLVGITGLSVDANNASEVARVVKKTKKDTIVVRGGAHVSVRTKECLREEATDFIVFGEGEDTMLELLQELQKQKPAFSHIKGLGYKNNGNLQINPTREPITDLDRLPLPAFDLLSYSIYFKAIHYLQGARGFCPNRATVITSRGCPYKCNFCSISQIMGRRYRSRSAENVIKEIGILVNDYGIKEIGFEDDNVSYDRERFETICDLIIEKKLNIKWDTPNGIRADTLDEPLLKKMKQSGCKGIILSPEVGDQNVLNNIIGKKLDLKKIEEVIQISTSIGLPTGCFFMVGLIGETKTNMQRTVDFAEKLRELGAVTACFIAQPYYGTALYRQARENSYLLKQDGEELEKGFINMQPMIETPEFNIQVLRNFQGAVGAGAHEMKDILDIIKHRPLDALRCFSLHPIYISKYLFKNHLIKGTFFRL